MFHKLRNQLFLAFLSVGFLSLIQAVVQVTLTHQKEKVENAIKQMHLIEMNVMLQAKAINDFFALETRNTEFFKTQHSVYLANRQKLQEEFKSTGKFLPENRFFKDIDTERHYKKLDILSESLNKYVDSIATMIYLRGFKDYGIEGQMREKAHALENWKCIEIGQILMLRRHEKDFIIRNERSYIEKFNLLANTISEKIKDKDCKKKLVNYQKLFNQLVEFDHQIGVKDNTSLMLILQSIVSEMINETKIIDKECESYKSELYAELQILSITIFISILALTIYLSIILSRIATRRITSLSGNISAYVQSDFIDIQPIVKKSGNDEISDLIKHFELMREKINKQFHHLVSNNNLQKELIEQLHQTNATKDRFFSIIAHDLKSPFNALIGFSDLLRNNAFTYKPIKIQQFAHDINSVATRTYDLLENLLEWSRLETGELKPNPQSIIIEGIIMETVQLLVAAANHKNITLETELLSKTSITTDKNMIYTVLRNITSNAIKYTRNDGKIEIKTIETDLNLTICISDNGVGIEKNRLDKLFDIEEVNTTRGTHGEKGTGLGLLLCKELVGLNQGDLLVESKIGQGTKITVTLPKFLTNLQ